MGTVQGDVSRKKKLTRGGVGGSRVRAYPPLSLSLFSCLFFSRSLPSRRAPLSERLEQANTGCDHDLTSCRPQFG